MADSEYEIRKQICEIGRRIYDRGMAAANDGNISVKLCDNEYLCTPTGVSKGFMTPESICRVDREGKVLEAGEGCRPSSEIRMHMRIYQKRPDVAGVVHAHPVYATTFAVAGTALTMPVIAEAVVTLGCVPVAPYAAPSTTEVPDSVEPYTEYFDQVLLANHGALTWGQDLMSAYYRMESVEFYAKLLYKAMQLGDPKQLDGRQVRKLYGIRRQMGIPGRHPGDLCFANGGDECRNCDNCRFGGK